MVKKANSGIRLKPKLVELCKKDFIDTVNKKLDGGETPISVHSYILSKGFKISAPYVYEYAKIRKQCVVNNINIENLIGVAGKYAGEKNVRIEKSSSFNQRRDVLRSELEVLDQVIMMGYDHFPKLYGIGKMDDGCTEKTPIRINTLMDAIKLKNDLTEGSHGFLTQFGMESLRDLELKKYTILLATLLEFIPEDNQQRAIDKIELVEDEYYQETEYYEEFLKAKGLTDEEINKRLIELSGEEVSGDEPTPVKI